MAWSAADPIPDDMWVCHECKAGNLIELTTEQCPECEHWRCDWCYGPGDYLPDETGLFPGHPELSYGVAQHNHRGHNGPYQLFHQSPGMMYQNAQYHDNLLTDFDDLWHCNECGADNVNWCTECPVCGANRATSYYSSTSARFTTMGGAGSTAPGTWVCGECGCPNSEVCVACGQCGASK